jgi:hypothetical protein
VKKRYLFAACAIPIATWLAVPFLVQYPGWMFSKVFPECQTGLKDEQCVAIHAALGQSGDIFGVASSLFSGLALFAVAATLWVDYAARRTSRKPLVVCTIDETKEVSFFDPAHKRPRSIRFRAAIKVEAANDTAMNTSVDLALRIGKYQLEPGRLHVQVPLLSGQDSVLEFAALIGEAEIKKIIDEFAKGSSMYLDVRGNCNSLEGLNWETAVTYELTFHNSDIELIRKLLHDEAVLLDAWQGGAAVRLDYKIEPDSWTHRQVVTSRPKTSFQKIIAEYLKFLS